MSRGRRAGAIALVCIVAVVVLTHRSGTVAVVTGSWGSVANTGEPSSAATARHLEHQLKDTLKQIELLESETGELSSLVADLRGDPNTPRRNLLASSLEEGTEQFHSLRESIEILAPGTEAFPQDALKGKSICIVSVGISGPIQYGSIGELTLRQVSLYAKYGARVTVVYVGPFKVRDFPYWKWKFGEAGIALEVPHLHDADFSSGTGFMRVSYDLYLHFKGRAAKDEIYDMIMFHDMFGLSHYVSAAKRGGSPEFAETAIVIRCQDSSQLSSFFSAHSERHGSIDLIQYATERKSLELADFVFAPSEWYLRWMGWAGYRLRKESSFTVSNLVPLEVNTVETRAREHSPYFAFFGQLEQRKGLFVFLDALDLISKRDVGGMLQKVKFFGREVVLDTPHGKMKSYDYIKLRSKEWTFPYSVVTDKPTIEVLKYLQDKKMILVNPALGEATSLITMEAAAAGIPVIVSNVSGISELLENTREFADVSFPRGDTEALVERMVQAMNASIPVMKPRVSAEAARNLHIGMALHALDKKNHIRRSVPSSQKTSVTIGVPTVDRMKEVEECLQSFTDMEVVDNLQVKVMLMYAGKSDDVFAAKQAIIEKMQPQFTAKNMQLTLRRMENPGFASAARNEIFRLADTEFVLLFDDDDIAHPKMLSRMVGTALATGGKVVTGFAQNFDVGTDGERVLGSISLVLGSSPESSLLVDQVGKATMLLDLETVRAVGGCTIDENGNTPFGLWDLYSKFEYAGYEVEIVPDVVYYYRHHSANRVNYSMQDQRQSYFYGHYKRVQTLCSMHDIPKRSCVLMQHLVQLHAQPSAIASTSSTSGTT